DFRLVPPGVVRYGAHVEKGAIVMPGYVNIGARVGAGSMVDTWATVGSCAQVGRGVHLSGGVGLGGVLEPPGARPVIIEDGAFIGSRCGVVEGVLVEEEAVLGAGVVLTSSTPIHDVTGAKEKVIKGMTPARSVVIPGMRLRRGFRPVSRRPPRRAPGHGPAPGRRLPRPPRERARVRAGSERHEGRPGGDDRALEASRSRRARARARAAVL